MKDAVATPAADHAVLGEILAAVSATGFHARRWAELRRLVFPGPDGWQGLKAWCADHAIECGIAFGHASKSADVHFRRPHRGAPAADRS